MKGGNDKAKLARALAERDEALEFQRATAGILASLRSSATDVRPVFDAIAANTLRLFRTRYAAIFLLKGDMLELATVHGDAEFVRRLGGSDRKFRESFPQPVDYKGFTGKALRSGKVSQLVPIIGNPRATPRAVSLAKAFGYDATVMAPLVREGEVIGAIGTVRSTAERFTDKEMRLLKTFSDQAVIAIENARLFNETKEALERQTATAEILRVISGSPTKLDPVFDAILHGATRLCGAQLAVLNLYDGQNLRTVAQRGASPEFVRWLFGRGAYKPTYGQAEMVAKRRPLEYADMKDTPAYREGGENARKFVDVGGTRSYVAVPLIKEDRFLGAIAIYRTEVRPFTRGQVDLLQTFASQAVIAIENTRLFNETKDALERQTATAEILQVIGSSPTDTQPVFDAIVNSGVRLFPDAMITVARPDGGTVRAAAIAHQDSAMVAGWRERFTTPLSRDRLHAAAIIDAKLIDFPDAEAEKDGPLGPGVRNFLLSGNRAVTIMPMLRGEGAIGAISVTRAVPGPLSDKQIAILRTFADQAVIAIENVRLFNETKEALERQTATAEILRVIASSPTAVQPVFDTIVESAVRLCGARFGRIYRHDGSLIQMVASHGLSASGLAHVQSLFPRPATSETIAGSVILERRPRFVRDLLHDDTVPALSRQMMTALETRSQVTVPMLRAGEPIGAITIGWAEPDGFEEKQVALLQTFADQAVIAIENARLFNETKEALERQTATAEILRVISSSPTDTQPVFEAIVQSGLKLFPHAAIVVTLPDGDRIRLAAIADADPLHAAQWKERHQFPLTREYMHAVAILDGTVIDVPDAQAYEGGPLAAGIRNFLATGNRAITIMPMLRGNAVIGTISVIRRAPGPLTEKQFALLRTFADQAVIAIENVRLFNETKEALERQTATSEILKVISSSTTDTQPVFEAIVRSAARLFPTSNATIFMRDGDLTRLCAFDGETVVDSGMRQELARIYPIRFDPEVSTSARAMVEGRVNICLDTEAPGVPEHIRRAGRAGRFRSNTVVPLLREGEGIGTIVITHPEPGHRLNEKQLALLQTFADQAVIAIENVRLFNETREALEQQTATADILKVISGSLTDTAPIFRAIVESASRLCDGRNVVIVMREEGGLQLRAWAGSNFSQLSDDQLQNILGQYPLPFDTETSASARAIAERRVIEVLDAEAPDAPEATTRIARLSGGWRSATWVPLLRDDEGIGTIVLTDPRPGASLSEKQLTLLRTFASQAVIAIENVRLFREIREKSAQLEVANRHKSEFLANMSHELRTPLNAIIGFSEVLIEKMFGEVNEKQADYLKDIHESGRHLLSLINDILDLSKIEAGRMELDLGSFDLPGAISNAMTLVRERAQRHGVALASEIDPRLGPFNADERKVKQILLNLLSNAVKFTSEGGRVDVSAKLDTDKVEIAVKDTGVGISAEDQQRLFEEFRQVGKDSARKAEGTGLGLALTRKFVELHGGEIRVDSAPGRGSTFMFTLPVR